MDREFFPEEMDMEEVTYSSVSSMIILARNFDSFADTLEIDTDRLKKNWNNCVLHVPQALLFEFLEDLIEYYAEEEKYEMAQLVKTMRDHSNMGFIKELNI